MINTKAKPEKPVIKFVDLFAGIGGFHLGISQAAKNLDLDSKCILAVDINENARKTYEGYFQMSLMKNVKDVKIDHIPEDIDIVCGGFPCQPFSQAGKKLGEADDRGSLFRYIVDILCLRPKKERPKVVFLENVKNLLNIKNGDGNTIDSIRNALLEAGYDVGWIQTYKASDFGLPTHRPRVYIVGFRDDLAIAPPNASWWPAIEKEKVTLKQYFYDLDKEWFTLEPKIEREGWPDIVGRTLRVGGVGSAYKSREWLKKHPGIKHTDVDDDRVWVNDPRTWDSYLFFKNTEKEKAHAISINEAKAIMGFPHDFEFPPESLVSRTQQMKQLGNSVAVPVIRVIAEKIIETIYPGYIQVMQQDKNGPSKS